MKILTSTDLKNWAGTLQCQSHLPLLIRKLIYAGVDIDNIKKIDFPYSEDIQVGGYDGQLEIEKGNHYVPDGDSVWEFGVVESGKKTKADSDYEKRKADPLGRIQSETTYINVTLKKYTKKKQWVDEKKAEGIWADVRFYDAIDIEHWLDRAPSVEIWLARLMGKPVIGVQCADDYWSQWSNNGEIQFPYDLLLGTREVQKNAVVDFLQDSSRKILRIKSNTSEESLAFGLAVLESLSVDQKNNFHTKALVVEKLDSFRQLIESSQKLILFPKFKLEDVDANHAKSKGHKIIIPLSNTYSSDGSNLIILPMIRSEVFKDNLVKMGINREQAQLLSVNTGKDISVLRRSLGFSSKQPKWMETIDPIFFVPFLLIGRYDTGYEGDREIVEKITKSNYDNYEKSLRKILNCEETPIYNVGVRWRIISHSDSWVYMAKFITDADLAAFYDIAVEVLTETNPKYGLDPEKRYMASFYNATPKYSHYLKKGICETLIILSVLSKKYGLNTTLNPENFVDKVVDHILSMGDSKLLRSIGDNLVLLAEASPRFFVQSIQKAIDDKKVDDFFELEKNHLYSSADLSYLLRALERIAWMPEYLTMTIRLICQLIQIQPEELTTSYKPISSLIGIFKLWFPQTNASMEERKQVLEIIKKEYPDIAFGLFSSLIYNNRDSAISRSKMRWRLFSETREVRVTYQELHYMHNYSVESLVELTTGSEFTKALVLIEKLRNVNWDKIDSMLNCIESYLYESEENKAKVYHTFRRLIGRHRTLSHTNWALPKEILERMEITANKFKPDNNILAKCYLFEEHHPELMEGYSKELNEDYQKKGDLINTLRKETIEEFLEILGIKEIISLSKRTPNTYLYANALSETNLSSDNEKVIIDLVNSEDDGDKWFFSKYMAAIERHQGRDIVFKKIDQLANNEKYQGAKLAHFYLPLWADLELYKKIDALCDSEIEKEFWIQLEPFHFQDDIETTVFAIEKFLKFDRPISVLNTLAGVRNDKEELTTDYIVSTLDKLDVSKYNEPKNVKPDHYMIMDLFSNLHTREDVDEEKMAEIEAKLLFVFDPYGHEVLPKYLYKAISKRPVLFIDLIKECFTPEDDKFLEPKNDELSIEQRNMIFENAYSIISNFNIIPGLQADGNILEEELNNWIDQLRNLASTCGRAAVTDSLIGQILARFPIRNGKMDFPDVIHDTLERLNNIDIYRGFSNQIFNGMGVTIRAVDAGGQIERERIEHFIKLANKTRISHPEVAEVYRSLAREYERHAKREDEEALTNIIEY